MRHDTRRLHRGPLPVALAVLAAALAASEPAGLAAPVLPSAARESQEKPSLPPGAVRLVTFDRHGDLVAICAEAPGPALRLGSRMIPRTRVWIGSEGNMQQVSAGVGSCDPAWSPRGSQIAITAVDGLWVLSRDLTTTTHLVDPSQDTRTNEAESRVFAKPAWSSDGSRIGYLVSNGGTSWVEVVDARTGESRFKSEPETYSFRWEPGGRALRLGANVIDVP